MKSNQNESCNKLQCLKKFWWKTFYNKLIQSKFYFTFGYSFNVKIKYVTTTDFQSELLNYIQVYNMSIPSTFSNKVYYCGYYCVLFLFMSRLFRSRNNNNNDNNNYNSNTLYFVPRPIILSFQKSIPTDITDNFYFILYLSNQFPFSY